MARRNRTVHRLVAPAFVATAVVLLASERRARGTTSPLFVALGVLLLGSLLVLIVTGAVMFVQHYGLRVASRAGSDARSTSARRKRVGHFEPWTSQGRSDHLGHP
jgi:hypothetical protein